MHMKVALRQGDDVSSVETLLLRLAEALHRYGTPAHRLEEAMENIAQDMGVSVQVFSMPTGLFVAFNREGDQQQTHLLRVSNGELHLERQSDVDELAGALSRGQTGIDEALARLAILEHHPERFRPWLLILAFAVSALAVSRMLGGSWLELLVSLGGGLIAGTGTIVLSHSPHMARLAPAFISLSVALYVAGMAYLFGALAVSACHLAAIIVLVPGLSLTMAMVELSTQHLVSGTARIAGACSVLLQLGFGMAVGRLIGQRLFGVMPDVTSGPALPEWTFWLALLLGSASFLVLFRARPRDGLWVFVAGLIAVMGAKWGVWVMGPQLGPFAGAFLIGLASNLFARLAHRPSSIMMIPGIIFLVPGSVGLRSISAMMERHTVAGMEAAFSMLMIAVSLVFGVLMAALLLPPRRSL